MNTIQKRLASFCKREKYGFLSFALTMLIFIIIAIVCDLAPFGRYSLLSIDLHGQYYPMMNEKLSDYFSVWSWHGSLGFSSLVQSAYYTNSIFILLLAPFSEYAKISVLDISIFLKISLSSAFFAHYLLEKYRKSNLFLTAFGMMYGFSAYTLAFIAQPMWLDVVMLLPLVMLAWENMMQGGSPLRYTLLLAFAIFSNFYIAISLCLFLVLWFIVRLCSERHDSLSALCRQTGRFAGFSLLAGLLCSFMIIPLLFARENWISSELSFDGVTEWYHSLAAITDAFAFGAKASREYGVANLFCGSCGVFFWLLFLFNTEIPLKKRISFAVLSLFLFLSFEINLLDYIWHGFHFPNQLPARQSYLFIFLMLVIAYETLLNRKGLNFAVLTFSFILSAGFFLISIGKSANTSGRLVSVLLLVVIYFLFILEILWKKEQGKHMLGVVLSFVLLLECSMNGILVFCRDGGKTDALAYIENEADMMVLTRKYESDRHTFYRTEITPKFTFNTGQLYGAKGITYYSSTMNGKIYRLMESLGNRVYARNVSTVYQPTPIQDMMFGVRYHYMRNGSFLDYGERIEKQGTVSVYESPYALPIAYAVQSDIKRWMTVSVEEPKIYKGIDLQRKFLSLATGMDMRELASEMPKINETTENCSINGNYLYVRDIDGAMTYTAEFIAENDGLFYLDFDFTAGTYTAEINGKTMRTGSCGSDPLTSVGEVKQGDTVKISVKNQGYRAVVYGIRGWIFHTDGLERAHQTLEQNSLQVTYASDTRIKGTISVGENGVLYASIPMENGWDVYIDGEKQTVFDLDAGLLCCDITAGEHLVEYRYRAPGLAMGILISAAAWIVLAVYQWQKRKLSVKDGQ